MFYLVWGLGMVAMVAFISFGMQRAEANGCFDDSNE
jgi:hypothetical protein